MGRLWQTVLPPYVCYYAHRGVNRGKQRESNIEATSSMATWTTTNGHLAYMQAQNTVPPYSQEIEAKREG
jgi:hypothetical protein